MKHLNLVGVQFGCGWWHDRDNKDEAESFKIVVPMTRTERRKGVVDGGMAEVRIPIDGASVVNSFAVICGGEDFLYIGQDEELAEKTARDYNLKLGGSSLSKWRAHVQGFGPALEENRFNISPNDPRFTPMFMVGQSSDDRLLVTFAVEGRKSLHLFHGGSLSPKPATILHEVSVRDSCGSMMAVSAIFGSGTRLVIKRQLPSGDESDYGSEAIVFEYHGEAAEVKFSRRVRKFYKWKEEAEFLEEEASEGGETA